MMQLIENPKHGDALSAKGTMYPCLLGFITEPAEFGSMLDTTYGYVLSGVARLNVSNSIEAFLPAGAFFSVPDRGHIVPNPDCKVVLIKRYGFRGQTIIGLSEDRGRLSYIDGCSDSMLIYPPRYGDPSLNYLHFPAGIIQTQHTHPSVRIGVVADGGGMAWRGGDPMNDEPADSDQCWRKPLKKGCVFMLEEQELHSFMTRNSHMDVIAFHPDGAWGPQDENHTMLNRTYINHGK